MRRLANLHHDPRRERRQLELFVPTSVRGAGTPEWHFLPAETRQALTHLVACLILDHAGGDRARRLEETRHDD
jgi:hypothetical protein